MVLRQRYQEALAELGTESITLLQEWPERKAGVQSEKYSYSVRGREITGNNYRESLSHQKIPKIAAPHFATGASCCCSCRRRTCRAYPYTAASIPIAAWAKTRPACSRARARRSAPISAFTTCRWGRTPRAVDGLRFGHAVRRGPARAAGHLRQGRQLRRFDRHVDDMKKLYSGFDLCAPTTSVSMTINGPAPMILAFFMNSAIDQQVEKHLRETGHGRRREEDRRATSRAASGRLRGRAAGGQRRSRARPAGVSGDKLVDAETYARIARRRSRRCAARCRPTSSRKTRRRTPAFSRPSSR